MLENWSSFYLILFIPSNNKQVIIHITELDRQLETGNSPMSVLQKVNKKKYKMYNVTTIQGCI